MPHRISIEGASHQQVVLRTPYGTFYREEMSGFYGMMHDPPRRRCHTLDRDTLTRPARLHTIEEGNRRRYTMDRDYINKVRLWGWCGVVWCCVGGGGGWSVGWWGL